MLWLFAQETKFVPHEKLLAVVRSGYANRKGTLQRHTGTCSFIYIYNSTVFTD